MPSKNYTLFFILSVGFVLITMAFITILGQTTSKDGEATDIRAKATVANSLKLVGNVISIDPSTRTLVVSDVKFESKKNETQTMGTWTVTIAGDVNMTTITPGRQVLISADASTFNITNNTMTALAVSPL